MEADIVSRSANTASDAQVGRCTVTIGLVDGSAHVGALGPFSPVQADLTLRSPEGTRQLLAAERVAYIAYHKGGEHAAPSSANAEPYKIYVGGRKEFRVLARISGEKKTLGFSAIPADGSSPFSDIFFYHHGVLAKEKDE